MDEGNQGHIEKLSKAEVYIPPEKTEDISLSQIFNNSQVSAFSSNLDIDKYLEPIHGIC